MSARATSDHAWPFGTGWQAASGTRREPRRSGFTLVELLIAVAITAMMAAAMAGLTQTVQISSTYSQGVTTMTQHARVALERIQMNVAGAVANQNFPGAVVFNDTIGGQSLPDTLVVWNPTGAAANPTGLPEFQELIVYCPNPNAPNQLLEITWPGNTQTVPPLTDTVDWATDLTTMKTGTASTKTLITDLMRSSSPGTAASGGPTSAASLAGCVRFETVLHPTASDWTNYRAGTLPWINMSWVQGICGSTTGLAQCWVRVELQMLTGYTAVSDPTAQQVVPFFGSATLNYQVSQ